MNNIFQDEQTEAALLTDAANAFNFVNRNAFNHAWGLQLYLKRDSGTGGFLWILRNS